MRRTGSITARSLGRQIFDPGATTGVTWGVLQPHFGFSGNAAAQNPPPDGLQGCLLGLLFPWAPPQQGKQGASCGRLASKVDRRRRGERFFGELTLSRCQSSRREGLQLTSSSSCDETCLCRRQVLRARPSTRSFTTGDAPGHDIMRAESCRLMIRDRKGSRQHCSLPSSSRTTAFWVCPNTGLGPEKTLIGT